MPHNSKPQLLFNFHHHISTGLFLLLFSLVAAAREAGRHPVMEWNATITDMKFHFKNNAFRATTTNVFLV